MEFFHQFRYLLDDVLIYGVTFVEVSLGWVPVDAVWEVPLRVSNHIKTGHLAQARFASPLTKLGAISMTREVSIAAACPSCCGKPSFC